MSRVVFVRCLAVVFVLLSVIGCGEQQDPATPQVLLNPADGCIPTEGCSVAADGLSFTLRFDAAPRALQPFPVSAVIDRGENAREVFVSFSMQGMDMGPNRYRLVSAGGQHWTGNVTLPICVSGRSDWVARFELHYAERTILLPVPFTLSRQ